jgi:hypothetical protein
LNTIDPWRATSAANASSSRRRAKLSRSAASESRQGCADFRRKPSSQRFKIGCIRPSRNRQRTFRTILPGEPSHAAQFRAKTYLCGDSSFPPRGPNPGLALLADALEDAGCIDADLLGHLREPGPHVLGCWAVDLVLGKS